MPKKLIKNILRKSGFDVVRHQTAPLQNKMLYEKYHSYTMISEGAFVHNLELCEKYKDLPGEFVECGVWRGGMSAAISEVIGIEHKVHLFDSFEGLPPATEVDGPAALKWQSDVESPQYYDNCTADEHFAKEAMALANNTNYALYKGWFESTLQNYEGKGIAILRLDADWYNSMIQCLDSLYPLVIKGGLIVLDDYYAWDGCARAVHDYLSKVKSASRVHQWKNQIPYIVKQDG